MRKVTQISAWTRTSGEFLALCSDGTLWKGKLMDGERPWVQWTPVNNPPEGEFWNRQKDFWSRLEEQLRETYGKRDDLRGEAKR